MKNIFKSFYFSLVALLGLCGAVALGNYAMTQGVGTNFGSIIVGGVHYAQQLFCDPTSVGQCAAVSSGGAVKVDNSAVTQPISAASLPLPTGAATNSALTTINTTLGSPMQNTGGSVTANAGTNLNTSALALETGGNLAQVATDIGAPGSVACASDTSSCSTNQQMQRLAQRLTTVNTTLGSPFQAGGSIGNTSFGATQSGTWTVQPGNTANTTPWLVSASQSGTWNITNISGTVSLPTGASTAAKQPAIGTAGVASADILTVQGIASMTPLLVTLSGTNNINNISGTISLPTGAATSANQTNASQKTQIVDGSGNVIASTSNNLNVQCANCSGSGASAADEATFTAGTSVLAPGGGFFQTTATSNPLTSGQQGMVQMTANRAFFTNLRNASGTEIGTNGNPLRIDPVGTTTQPVSQTGTWTVSQSTAANLNMTCANCSGSGASGTDEGGFTAGSSIFAPAGGFFQTTATSNPLTTGQWGAWQMTANRAGFVNLRNASGTEIGTSTTPVQVSLANTAINATAVKVDGSGVTQPVSLAANQSVNVAQINGVTPLMGNGTTGTGSQRVTIASDNTAFSVNATLQASATTAIGKIDPNTIGSWGLQTATQNSATPTNVALVGGQFNTTPTTITTGNMSPFQLDNAGNLLVNVKAGGAGGGAVTGGIASSVAMQSGATANGNGTTLTVTGYQTALVNVNCSVACSGGTTINFEGTDSTGTFFSLAAFPVTGTSTVVSSATTSGQFWVPVSALTTIRARISAYSAGTITVTGTPIFGVNSSLSQVVNTNANGQQTMANSSPVVIASNQSAITVNNATASNLNATVSQATGTNLHVVCDSGCSGSGGTSSNFGSAFPSAGTATGFTDGTNMVAGRVAASGADGVSNTTTQLFAAGLNYIYNGTTWDRVRGTSGAMNMAGTGTAGAAAGGVLTVQGVASMTPFLTNPGTSANWGIGATGSAVPANAQLTGGSDGTNTRAISTDTSGRIVLAPTQDPCSFGVKTNATIATSSGTLQLVAPSGSTQVYVCSLSLVAAATAVVNLVGGTGATCTTGTPVAAFGSTTAASGASLAANGGLTLGSGVGTVARTTTAGHGLCLIQSGTTALAGNITYVQQ